MNDFATFREEALDQQPLLYETNLSNVQVDSDESAVVDGKTLPMDRSGFDDLRSIAGVPKRFSRRADDRLGEGTSTKLVEAMRSGLADEDDSPVSVAIDRSNERVVGFNDDVGQMISMEGYFDLAERIIDRYGLDIDDTVIGTDGTVRMSLKKDDRQINLDGFGDALDDETFKAGISIASRLGQVEFESYLYRLICTNGMIGEFWGDDMEINSLDRDTVFEFFDQVDQVADNGFLPEQFGEAVSRANETYASLRELESLHAPIRRAYEGDNPEQPDRFIPLQAVRAEYRNDGIEPTELTERQKRNAVTPVTVWDAINGLTRFASHDYTSDGFNVSDITQSRLMVEAGRTLEQNRFDMENLVPMPSGFELN